MSKLMLLLIICSQKLADLPYALLTILLHLKSSLERKLSFFWNNFILIIPSKCIYYFFFGSFNTTKS